MDAAFNIALYQLLAEWNPMQFKALEDGDQEIYDCMDVIHQKLTRDETIERIQAIYQFNFETTISYREINAILDEVEKIRATCKL